MTSRAVLHINGEHEFAVSPLAVPDPKHLPPIEVLSEYAGLTLFIQRAQAVKPDFQLTEANASIIARICARLDGLPLATELAGARIKLLPPNALLTRLESRLQVLTGGARNLPTRQQTLRNTLQWSYDLLNADERQLFRRLSVFVGGCTLVAAEAVEKVGSSIGDPATSVLDKVASLIDNSMLYQVEQANGEPRLMMLETIREYGLETLTSSGEEEAIRQAHAVYYLALVEQTEPKLFSAEQSGGLERLETEHDNLRAALRWSMERGKMEMNLRLGGALWRFWFVRGYLSEGRRWLEEALDKSHNEEAMMRAKALNGAGELAYHQGDYNQAAALCEESLRLFRQAGDKRGIASSLNGLAIVARDRHQYAEARAMYEEMLMLLRELGDTWGIASSLSLLGETLWMQGDYMAARPLLEESLALFREIGDRAGTAEAQIGLAQVLQFQGDLPAARSLFEEVLTIARELGFIEDMASCLRGLGMVACGQEDYAAARSQLTEALAIFSELGAMWHISSCLTMLAWVAAMQRLPQQAARLFGAGEASRDAIGMATPVAFRAKYEHYLAIAQEQLDEKAFAAAWAEGRAMTPEQAIAEQRREIMLDQRTTVAQSALVLISTQPYPDELTRREVDVLRLVAQGLTNAQVAEKLVLSRLTVNAYLRSIYSKLGINSRTAAMRYAIDHKFV